jgi:hypothetical protein
MVMFVTSVLKFPLLFFLPVTILRPLNISVAFLGVIEENGNFGKT